MEDLYIVGCACGKKLRVRGEQLGQKVKCPHCGTVVPVPQHSALVGQIAEGASRTAGPEEVGKKCAVCQNRIEPGTAVVYCDKCRIPFHLECWEENGGCATYACERSPKTAKMPGVQPASQGWGDSKICPACGREIRSIALKCMHCGARFETADPIAAADFRRQAIVGEKVKSARKTAVVLFVLSMLGCLGFIILPVSAWWVYSNRKALTKVPGEHMALAWAAIVISAFYTLALLIFVILD